MRDAGELRLLRAFACVMTGEGPGQFARKPRARRHDDDRDWFAFERLCEVLGQATQDPTDPVAFRPERPVGVFKRFPAQPTASSMRQMTPARSSKQS
jgi:hypothetical protein